MDGGLQPDGCDIYQALDLLIANMMANAHGHPLARLRFAVLAARRRIDQYNSANRSRANVAHHYDLNGRLYSLFLDRDRQYSCAYFQRGDETLEEAQAAKKRHIAAKLCLDRPDLTVLDIGSGWGGLGLTLARDYGARVLGVTLSTEQLAESRARAHAEGLTDRVRSNCWTIVRSPNSSTASSRSACSSTSASSITGRSSRRSGAASNPTA